MDFKDSVFQSTAIIILFDAQAVTTLVGPFQAGFYVLVI